MLVGTVLVFASRLLLSCLLVVTVLVFASHLLLSCMLVVTVLVFASQSSVVMSVGGCCSGVC